MCRYVDNNYHSAGPSRRSCLRAQVAASPPAPRCGRGSTTPAPATPSTLVSTASPATGTQGTVKISNKLRKIFDGKFHRHLFVFSLRRSRKRSQSLHLMDLSGFNSDGGVVEANFCRKCKISIHFENALINRRTKTVQFHQKLSRGIILSPRNSRYICFVNSKLCVPLNLDYLYIYNI